MVAVLPGLRGASKGAALALLGRLPGGAHAYRELTRVQMGTQATHVDKLSRVLPGYLTAWRERCGLELSDGLRLWIHEPGWTPFWALASYLLTGQGGVLTNIEARMLDRYLARAVNGVLALALPAPQSRLRRVEALRWEHDVRRAVAALGARLMEGHDEDRLPLPSGSVDLAHSGGALEHYTPARLRAFLAECHRILRPGGIASHVLDHRDHLHHADHGYPFLAHLALPEPLYRALLGGPLTYHNRLSPARVVALFEEAGFERVALRRLVLPDPAASPRVPPLRPGAPRQGREDRHAAPQGREERDRRYVDDEESPDKHGARPGLPRALLAPGHRDISEADLRTAAGHYLFRKPM